MVASVQPHTLALLHALSRSVRTRRPTPSRWKYRICWVPASVFDQDLGSFGHDIGSLERVFSAFTVLMFSACFGFWSLR